MDKQIEEMARELREIQPLFYASIAEQLYNAGYRKIPEGAVVLTREEYEKHKGFSREEVDEISETAIKNSRKETAEKFASRVKMAFYYEFDELIPSIMADKIDEICKEITEGK